MRPNGDTKPFTRWELYNAITDVASHNEKITANTENWLQEVAQTVLKNDVKQLVELTALSN